MDKETFESQHPFAESQHPFAENHHPFAGDKKESMQRRCADYDYTETSMYMITLTIEGRRPLFGQVVGRSDASGVHSSECIDHSSECIDHNSECIDHSDEPRLEPSELGRLVMEEWYGIPSYYPQIKVIALQLMPDHLHGILWVREKLPCHLSKVIAGFKTGCNRHYRRLYGNGAFPIQDSRPVQYVATQSQQTGPAPQQPAALQQPAASHQLAAPQTAAPRRNSHPAQGLLFSIGYNDKILFRRGQLQRWLDYLHDNPRRLLMRREHPQYLRVQRNVVAAGITFSAIGNVQLLKHPELKQVQLSRRLTEQEVERVVQSFLAAARNGAVLVSPKISSGEKAVLNAAFAEGLPLIVLQENGFTDLDKPKGAKLMEACAEGRLLLLAPWAHHNERTTITRQQCLALNEMARKICEE